MQELNEICSIASNVRFSLYNNQDADCDDACMEKVWITSLLDIMRCNYAYLKKVRGAQKGMRIGKRTWI